MLFNFCGEDIVSVCTFVSSGVFRGGALCEAPPPLAGPP